MGYNIYGLIEAISFKLILDFVKYLERHRIYLSHIMVDYKDFTSHEFITFDNLDIFEVFRTAKDNYAVQEYFNIYYFPLYMCDMGRLVSIQSFELYSDIYDFYTQYKGLNVISDKYKLIQGSDYDKNRELFRKNFKDRQVDFINIAVDEYVKFYNEIKYIYETGIYSLCYAEPGWSENTWWLKSLRDVFMKDNTDRSKFPYRNVLIEKNPK